MWERDLVGFAWQVQDAVNDAVLLAKIVSGQEVEEEDGKEEESSSSGDSSSSSDSSSSASSRTALYYSRAQHGIPRWISTTDFFGQEGLGPTTSCGMQTNIQRGQCTSSAVENGEIPMPPVMLFSPDACAPVNGKKTSKQQRAYEHFATSSSTIPVVFRPGGGPTIKNITMRTRRAASEMFAAPKKTYSGTAVRPPSYHLHRPETETSRGRMGRRSGRGRSKTPKPRMHEPI